MARRRTGTLLQRPKAGRQVWHAQITTTVDGVTKRPIVCLDTEDKTLARRKLRRLVAENQRPGEEAEPVRLYTITSDFADTWIASLYENGQASASDDEQRLRDYVLPFIGEMRLSDVRASHVNAALVKAAERVGRETVKKIRGVALRMFKQAWREDLCPSKDELEKTTLHGKRSTKKRREVVSDDELAVYLAYPDADLEVKMLSIASRVVGGMRTGDLNQWSWSAVDVDTFTTAIVPRSKTDSPQTLELPEALRPHLRAWWERQGCPVDGPIFPVRVGKRAGMFKKEVSYAKRFRRDLRKALEASGVARPELFAETPTTLPVDFHSWRRAYCSALAEADINVQRATQLAGHSDAKTHLGYVARTKAMQKAPAAIIPQLPDAIAFEKQRFPARPGGFEPPTRGLEERDAALKPRDPADSGSLPDADSRGFPNGHQPDSQQSQLTRRGELGASLVDFGGADGC